MASDIDAEQARGNELPEHRVPARLVEIAADPERLEGVVAVALDALVGVAGEDVDEVGGAELLAGAVDRRQRLLGGERAVEALGGCRQLSQKPQPPWCSSPK